MHDGGVHFSVNYDDAENEEVCGTHLFGFIPVMIQILI
jgi:hypothetical protein